MKKMLLMILIMISIACVACNNEDNITNVTDTNITESRTTDIGTGQTPLYTSLAVNFYKCEMNEDTGEYRYGLFLNEDIVYRGNEVEIGVLLSVDMGSDNYENVPLLGILLLDGKLIPYSIDDSSYELTRKIEVINGEQQMYHLKFTPYGVNEETKKKLLFVAVPFYNNEYVEIYENDLLFHSKDIISVSGDVEAEELKASHEYGYVEELSQYNSEDISEFTKYEGEVCDCIAHYANDIDYIGGYETGSYMTLLFCDGELYSGFDKENTLLWEIDDTERFVCKKIDMSDIENGNHVMFALTIGTNTDSYNVKKSFNCEVTVNEDE